MNKQRVVNIENFMLNDKPNEDMTLIDVINGVFLKKRGYVFKMPKPGTPVVVCMSGGQDSTATIAILLEEFGLRVFPFFINRHQSNYKYEKASTEYYDSLFSKRYPRLYNTVFEIKLDTPSISYKNQLTEELRSNHIGYPARNSIIFLTGAEYAYSLLTKGIKCKTIFGAVVSSDGLYHSSLTWTRITNLSLCQFFNDYEWQFTSIAIEQCLGNAYDKDVLIKYCNQINIPLENTRTCTENSAVQCGKCICCYDRRRCFQQANVKDLTQYLYSYPKTIPPH